MIDAALGTAFFVSRLFLAADVLGKNNKTRLQ